MRILCILGRVIVLVVAVIASGPGVAAQNAKDPSDAAILERLRLVGMGEYMIQKQGAPPIGIADVDLCVIAMRREDTAVSSRGCLGLAALARFDFMAKIERARLDEIIDMLTARVDAEHADTSSWSTRALTALGRSGRHDPKGKPSLLTAKQVRRVVSKALAMAMRSEPRLQHSAGQLLRGFLGAVGDQVHTEIGRTLLAAIAKHRKPEADSEAHRLGLSSLKGALTMLPMQDAEVAAEMARLFLAEAKKLDPSHWSFYSKVDNVRGLARILGRLTGDVRADVFAYLEMSAQDLRLSYMLTSGIRTPYHHHGADAIEVAAPVLTRDEWQRAAAALAGSREKAKADRRWGFKTKDLSAMFDAAEKALAARKEALAAEGAKKRD